MVISCFNIVNVKQADEKCIRLSGNLHTLLRKAKHKLCTLFGFEMINSPTFCEMYVSIVGQGRREGKKWKTKEGIKKLLSVTMHNSLYLGSGLVAIYINLQEDFNF